MPAYLFSRLKGMVSTVKLSELMDLCLIWPFFVLAQHFIDLITGVNNQLVVAWFVAVHVYLDATLFIENDDHVLVDVNM
jgi:hypothetical protein